jgi:hypothetical protein
LVTGCPVRPAHTHMCFCFFFFFFLSLSLSLSLPVMRVEVRTVRRAVRRLSRSFFVLCGRHRGIWENQRWERTSGRRRRAWPCQRPRVSRRLWTRRATTSNSPRDARTATALNAAHPRDLGKSSGPSGSGAARGRGTLQERLPVHARGAPRDCGKRRRDIVLRARPVATLNARSTHASLSPILVAAAGRGRRPRPQWLQQKANRIPGVCVPTGNCGRA